MAGAAPRTLWISWYPHRRTTGLCDAWGIPLEIVSSREEGLRKWLFQSIGTLRLLMRHRPDILFVQNPSLGLTVLALWVRWLFGYFLVVDAHNEGVRPFIRTGWFVRGLTRHLLRRGDAMIVTNAALAADVRSAGGVPMVLPDRLPALPSTPGADRHDLAEPPDVAVISTYAPDEPIGAVLEAAWRMPDVRFAITGNVKRFTALGLDRPHNVHLTGFLPEDQYWGLLARSRIVCDLTLMPDCLVCGAYEGLALARPMVLSDNPPTRALFGHGAVLTQNDADSIETALRTALDQAKDLEGRARESRELFCQRWQADADSTWKALLSAAASSRPSERRTSSA